MYKSNRLPTKNTVRRRISNPITNRIVLADGALGKTIEQHKVVKQIALPLDLLIHATSFLKDKNTFLKLFVR